MKKELYHRIRKELYHVIIEVNLLWSTGNAHHEQKLSDTDWWP